MLFINNNDNNNNFNISNYPSFSSNSNNNATLSNFVTANPNSNSKYNKLINNPFNLSHFLNVLTEDYIPNINVNYTALIEAEPIYNV